MPGHDIRHAHLHFQELGALYSDSASPDGTFYWILTKALDIVVWSALDMVLMHFGFGHNFRRWIQVHYSGTLVYLMFNGSPLDPFELGDGICEGGPLSPVLFVLFIDPLLNYTYKNLHDKGLQCGSSILSVNGFADNCTGIMHDLRHIKNFLGYMKTFCSATGMRLNEAKTVLLPFRPWSGSFDPLRLELELLGVEVVGNSGRVVFFGVYYGSQLFHSARLQHLITAMQTRCSLGPTARALSVVKW